MSTTNRKLRVFLCHASQDKPVVRELYQRLLTEGWIDPWLDEEKLIVGQDWDMEIEKAVETSDAVIVCLSNHSVTKEGYIQKELKTIVKKALEKPEGVIFIIPLRLEECSVPRSLGKYQYQDYFPANKRNSAYERLIVGLKSRAESLEISTQVTPVDLYKFVSFPWGEKSHDFWISKYPVTNIQYERFLKDPYYDPRVALTYKSEGMFDNRDYWKYHPMFEKRRAQRKVTDNVVDTGYKWITERLAESRNWYDNSGKEYLILPGHEPEGGRIRFPDYWGDADFGIAQKNVPVVGVSWYEASAYCRWLQINWFRLEESEANNINFSWVRLPTRKEWEIAAGGRVPTGRYPWDRPNEITRDIREIFDRANVANHVGKTTPVDKYLKGASPRGVMDMGGNVWEWLANISSTGDDLAEIAGDVPKDEIPSYGLMEMIGGSWKASEKDSSLDETFYGDKDTFPDESGNDLGFRVVLVKT
jgi:formylglycine-generating enzyme required for sulfatase activity